MFDRKIVDHNFSPMADNEESHEVSYPRLWAEIKTWRSQFSWSGLVTAILLGLVPSGWDIGSDYEFADENNKSGREGVTYLTYLFISMPGRASYTLLIPQRNKTN